MIETPEEFRQRIGRVEVGRSYEYQDRGGVIGHFIGAVALTSAIAGVAIWLGWRWPLPLLAGLAAFVVYCALSYFVRARPNHDHVTEGFAEYRVSDELNRFLIFLAIVLAPGRFISVGIVDGVRLFTVGRLPHEGPPPPRH